MLSIISNVNKGMIASNIFSANIFSSSQSIRWSCYKTTIDNVTASGYLYQSFFVDFSKDIKDIIIYLKSNIFSIYNLSEGRGYKGLPDKFPLLSN